LKAADYTTAAAMKKRATFVHTHLQEFYANQTRDEFEVREIKFPAEFSDRSHCGDRGGGPPFGDSKWSTSISSTGSRLLEFYWRPFLLLASLSVWSILGVFEQRSLYSFTLSSS